VDGRTVGDPVLHFVPGEGAAQPIVERLLSALPAGSRLVATHARLDPCRPQHVAAHQRMRERGRSDVWTRDRAEFAALVDGLELLEPGIVPVSERHPDPGTDLRDRRDVGVWGAVARSGKSDRATDRAASPYVTLAGSGGRRRGSHIQGRCNSRCSPRTTSRTRGSGPGVDPTDHGRLCGLADPGRAGHRPLSR
jgi:hypothetical protein